MRKKKKSIISPNVCIHIASIEPDKLGLNVGDVYKCEISYPLKNPYPFDIKITEDSLNCILLQVRSAYEHVYSEEERTLKNLPEYENSYNRGESDGVFGIWGHVLEDLYVEGLDIDTKAKTINLYIGS